MSEKPKTAPQKATQTRVDTIGFTRAEAEAWVIPDFQRQLKINAKVRALAEQIKADGGIIPGIVAFGIINRKEYLIDGQHRREAYLLSGCKEGYADVRYCHFQDMAEMGAEFVKLNSQLVKMRPDDVLRGLERSVPVLAKIREACPYIGYGQVRRGTSSAILSMSNVLRCWSGSRTDTPTTETTPAVELARQFSDADAVEMIRFLGLAHKAWGEDFEYSGCWNTLNLIMCAWVYRKMVSGQHSVKTTKIPPDLFVKCLMGLTTGEYIDWLVGRKIGERDRSPCYARIKAAFSKRIEEATGKPGVFPAPDWSHTGRGYLNRPVKLAQGG